MAAASKPHAALEKWIWVLIYGGLFLVILGIVAGPVDEVFGWSLAVPGGIATAVGIVLIYVRSRFKDSP
jgi:hypothetical protein